METHTYDDAVRALEARAAKAAAVREANRLRLRDRKLPHRTPEARRAQNLSWYSRNCTYERERGRLKYQWYCGNISRDQYLELKAEAYAKAKSFEL